MTTWVIACALGTQVAFHSLFRPGHVEYVSTGQTVISGKSCMDLGFRSTSSVFVNVNDDPLACSVYGVRDSGSQDGHKPSAWWLSPVRWQGIFFAQCANFSEGAAIRLLGKESDR